MSARISCNVLRKDFLPAIALLLALFMVPGIATAAQTTWSRTYGGSGYDEISEVIPTADGGFLSAGSTYSFSASSGGVWVVKLDSAGEIAWQNAYYGSTYPSGALSVIQTSDGGYVLAGFTYAFGAGSSDVWVLKLNPAGIIGWQRTYGGVNGDSSASIIQTSDGGYMVACDTESFGAGNSDILLLKLGAGGELSWKKTYGTSTDAETCTAVRQTSDGGYVVAGSSGLMDKGENYANGPMDAWVFRTDSAGSVIWEYFYGDSGEDVSTSLRVTSDGGYIVGGFSNSFSGQYDYDCWVLKLNASGAVTWQKKYGGPGDDQTNDIRQTTDGGFIMACSSNSIGAGDNDFWIVKLDSLGNIAWQKGYAGAGDDLAKSAAQTADGGYIVGGDSYNPASYGSDWWIMRLNTTGGIGTGCSFIFSTSLTAQATAVSPAPSYAEVETPSFSATDSGASPVATSAVVQLQCSGYCPSITLSPSVLPQAQTGVEYYQAITASGGASPYTYALGYTVPPEGITLSKDGILSGTPVSAGNYPLLVYAYDKDGCAGSNLYALSVGGGSCPAITLSPETLPTAIPGTVYSQKISASGGTPPYAFSLTGGSLPSGLVLADDGTITGTPSVSGSYSFAVTATDSAACSGSRTYALAVGCDGTTGALDGFITVSDEEGEEYYILDGPGVSGTVTATDSKGGTHVADISGGYFDFGELPYGPCSLVATIRYTDHIPYDASLLALGCPSPLNGVIVKSVSSPPLYVDVACNEDNSAMVDFEKPIVMLHGMFGCYEKWYGGDPADPDFYSYWDNYARRQGVISFTPNYEWWGDAGSWITRTEEVLDQVHRDMASLTNQGVPPFTLVAHDMGGLIARILGSPIYSDDPAVRQIRTAFIIGTPNSGFDFNPRSGKDGLLGPNSIIRYFNDAYPDFGNLDVYAIAGNRGWWGTDNNDGKVSLRSAFTITRVACKGGDCVAYPALSLDSGAEHVFRFRHNELGSPESVEEIFENVILLTGRSRWRMDEKGIPEAPVGGVGWGTVGRSSATMGTGSASLRSEASQDYPFTVSNCDGMAVFVTVTSGSGSFKIIDPSGFQHDLDNNAFIKPAPEPGTWILRANPGASGMTFDASAVDNSIFGIKAYLTGEYVGEGVKTTLRADRDGDWSAVMPSTVKAFMYDGSGNLVQSLDLADNGGYFSHEFGAPSSPGTYQIVVKAEGTYGGDPFTRVEFETLNVLPSSHYFTGTFSDSPVDGNGDGKYDGLAFSADVLISGQGYFVVSADLFDSSGNFLSHSTASISAGRASSQALLLFDLKDLKCSQLSSPLQVGGLRVLDADSLRAVDVWGQEVSTQSYSSSQFCCDPSEPAPQVLYVTPSSVVAGTTPNMAIVGRNFDENAIVTFDAGVGKLISVLHKENFENRVIYSTISIPASAVGHVNVRVTNPDGSDGVLHEVLVSEEDSAPEVSFDGLENGSVVGGYLDIIANASDDVKVASVSFELDGALQKVAASFPFIWYWDTSASAVGTHTVKATATDSAGHQASTQAVVSVVQPPVVSMMSKKGSPFRIVTLGSNLQEDITVYINGEMWTNVAWKSSGKIVIKGGSLLKSKVPKGTPTTFTFVNDDGGQQVLVWQW